MMTTFESLLVPMHFDITIDADNQDIQDKIAKNINNSLVFENLAILISKARKIRIPIYITVTTVVNAFNEKRVAYILERVRKCGIENLSVKSMGYYMGYLMRQEDINMIAEMETKGNIDKRFVVNDGKLVSHKSYCDSFIIPVIGVDGQVTVCCHDMLYHEAEWNILKTESLDMIIQTKEYEKKVNLGKKLGLTICKGCN